MPTVTTFLEGGGIDGSRASFGPSLAIDRDHAVLAWSEGLRRDTRIRAARFDVARNAIVGPIAEVSTPGHEAGFASVDAFEGHVAIAWDEKDGSDWNVLHAELRRR